MFGRLFGRKDKRNDEEAERLEQAWSEQKDHLMARLLGKEHDMVMHAIIPYAVGGGLDLYYYPHGIPGTAIATKELAYSTQPSSTNDQYRRYELVMFTRQPLSMDDAKDRSTPFGAVHLNINSILNLIARYSEQVKLNPRETCEFPEDMEGVGGKCLLFDAYEPNGRVHDDFGLMAVIEVFRSEMQFAMQHGGEQLLAKLRAAGAYPYSDLNREPVV